MTDKIPALPDSIKSAERSPFVLTAAGAAAFSEIMNANAVPPSLARFREDHRTTTFNLRKGVASC